MPSANIGELEEREDGHGMKDEGRELLMVVSNIFHFP